MQVAAWSVSQSGGLCTYVLLCVDGWLRAVGLDSELASRALSSDRLHHDQCVAARSDVEVGGGPHAK